MSTRNRSSCSLTQSVAVASIVALTPSTRSKRRAPDAQRVAVRRRLQRDPVQEPRLADALLDRVDDPLRVARDVAGWVATVVTVGTVATVLAHRRDHGRADDGREQVLDVRIDLRLVLGGQPIESCIQALGQ